MDRRALALCVVVTAATMDLVDGTVANIVLPVVQRDLAAGDGAAAAIASAYTLALGSLLTLGGRLGDLFGPRRVLGLGTAGFVAASALCAAAPGPGPLIAARLAQGAAGAVLVPQTLTVVQLLYPTRERGRALSVFAGVAGAATVAGPVLGALVTRVDVLGLGWRAVFALNIPVGALVLAGLRWVPGGVRGECAVPGGSAVPGDGPFSGGVDGMGSALLGSGIALLSAPLLWGSAADRLLWTAVSLAGGAAALTGFAVHQGRRARRGRAPLVDPRLLRFRSFRGALQVTALVHAAVFALFLTLALYLQGERGWTPVQAAFAVLPWAVGIPLTSVPASSRLVPRFGRRVLAVGTAAMLLGVPASAWGLHLAGDAWYGPAPGLFVAGCGIRCVVAPVLGLGLREVPASAAGTASGVLNTVQHVAGALGTGVLGGVYAAHLELPVGGRLLPVLLGVVVLLVGALLSVRLLPRRP
ncbi:MFS transporter [Streptomyces cacaoi]|uniref:MFS transporter n=1 Tax=Streptomyces cacaoi TaxID=1898 RepID=A0A4Y3R8G7_STRCI|nr:MFS transporter [Streptomyces cacaoi]NNG89139.1 MFS transporter [Streptomyces cacaoi]GEB53098.1 MFS transporter [Streptomyces cacaoi]